MYFVDRDFISKYSKSAITEESLLRELTRKNHCTFYHFLNFYK